MKVEVYKAEEDSRNVSFLLGRRAVSIYIHK